MSRASRALCFILALSLSVINPALAQPQSASNPSATPEANDLAAALARAGSEQEEDRLLEQKKELVNGSLLVALKDLVGSFDRKGDYAEAVRIAQLAVRIAESLADPARLGNALHNLGLMYSRQNHAEQARDCFQKCLAIFEGTDDKRGMARALFELGRIHRLQSRFDLALEYLDRSVAISEEIGNKDISALSLNLIGVIHRMQGRYELALEFYQKCRAVSEESGNQVMLALALNNIGDLYTFQGRYADALACFRKSVQIHESLGGTADKKGMALLLHNIGLVYKHQGRDDQALEHYHKSLKIREMINDTDGIAGSQNNIGVIYKSQGLYEQALESFQKSLKLFDALNNKDGAATCLNNIGDIYRRQKRYDLALEHLRKSLRLREEIDSPLGVSRTLKNLSLLYQDQGSYAEMLEASLRAARLAEQVNAPEDLWAAQESAGRAFRALGQPEAARRSFLDAIATIESLRNRVAGGEQQRQSFLENRLSPWVGMISLLVSQNEYAEALAFAERSKARVLLDTLQEGRASLRESLSQQERQAEEQHRFRLASLNSQLTGELRRGRPYPSRVAELKASLEKARLEYEDFETRLYVSHPGLKVKRGEVPVINSEELGALLPDGASALLEYVVADEVTYLFVVTRAAGRSGADVRGYTLPVKRIELARQVEAFRRQLAARDLGFRSPAAELYRLLLKPAEAQLRARTNLVIAPDDTLWDLPFQALLAGPNRFLIEETAISYAPSLTVLREMARRREKQVTETASTTLFALGNPLLGKETLNRAAMTLRDGGLEPLPEAEQEVKALGQLYGATRSKVYIRAEAREDRVKREAGEARILHFATHGTVNNTSPMYSHLVLTEGGSNEDGLLEAWELMRLELKAELAVLSACETARGRIGAGEGMIGLSWAMFIAGVPSIVVTQWKVESAGTRNLMVNFHRALMTRPGAGKAKARKSEALRESAMKLMRNPETRHPFYWAGFILVGDGR